MPSNESRIYVGNLPPDIRTKDIEDLFYKYGKIVFIDMKNRRGPPFAFVGKKNFKSLAFLWIQQIDLSKKHRLYKLNIMFVFLLKCQITVD